MSNILEHRTEIPTRQPTRQEAVEIMRRALTETQRRANLAYWRRRFGDEFPHHVEAEAKL